MQHFLAPHGWMQNLPPGEMVAYMLQTTSVTQRNLALQKANESIKTALEG